MSAKPILSDLDFLGEYITSENKVFFQKSRKDWSCGVCRKAIEPGDWTFVFKKFGEEAAVRSCVGCCPHGDHIGVDARRVLRFLVGLGVNHIFVGGRLFHIGEIRLLGEGFDNKCWVLGKRKKAEVDRKEFLKMVDGYAPWARQGGGFDIGVGMGDVGDEGFIDKLARVSLKTPPKRKGGSFGDFTILKPE